MKVSIIVPVYNVEEYVTECLNSVSNLNIDYEIIVVNDGSTDNSLKKVSEFANTFGGAIEIITQKNGGLSAARNTGIRRASGEYLFFLDSDDYIDKHSFERLVTDVVTDDVEMGFADYKYLTGGKIEPNNETAYRRKRAQISNEIVDGLSYGEHFFEKVHNFINTEAAFVIIKRSLLSDNNIEFKEGIYHEDTLFTLSCLLVSKRVKFYDYPFYIYRMRDNSIMHTASPQVTAKKLQDKKTIALDLFGQKQEKQINTQFLDTLIVDLLLVPIMHFKKKAPEVNQVLSACKKLTLKTKIRVAIFKVLSLTYA